jgi:outer membrane protein assembly factor BamB
MKKAIALITVVMGIVLFLLLGCTKLKDNPKVAMYRANLQRTGVYNTKGIHELGGLKWKFKLEGEAIPSPPIIFDGVIYFGASDGYLHAVDGNTGEEKWRFKTDGSSVSDPAIADGIVYFGSYDRYPHDSYLYAVDINTRQEKWKIKTDLWISGSPVISDGMAYFNCVSHLKAVDINTGLEKWKFEAEDVWKHLPSISDGVVYGVGYIGHCLYNTLYALDKKTGQEKWKFNSKVPMGSCPAISEGTVYITTGDDYLHAVYSNTGLEKCICKTEGESFYDLVIANGIVYSGSSNDSCLHAIDISTGQEKWKFKTETWEVSSPSIADGIVYFGAGDSCLYAVDANTGHEKWRFKIDAPVVSSPSIADGFVYLKSEDGILYALEGRPFVEKGSVNRFYGWLSNVVGIGNKAERKASDDIRRKLKEQGWTDQEINNKLPLFVKYYLDIGPSFLYDLVYMHEQFGMQLEGITASYETMASNAAVAGIPLELYKNIVFDLTSQIQQYGFSIRDAMEFTNLFTDDLKNGTITAPEVQATMQTLVQAQTTGAGFGFRIKMSMFLTQAWGEAPSGVKEALETVTRQRYGDKVEFRNIDVDKKAEVLQRVAPGIFGQGWAIAARESMKQVPQTVRPIAFPQFWPGMEYIPFEQRIGPALEESFLARR